MTMRKQLYSASEMESAIARMAAAIAAAFPQAGKECALVGIHQLGVPLAERLRDAVSRITGQAPEFGKLDISMYRDDIGNRNRLPLIRETEIPFDINGKTLILVDDVLSSGRTIRAALDALTDYGRPGVIRLAVLVDRGNPEFPIRADVIGFKIACPETSKIVVDFSGSPGIYERQWKSV